MKTLNVSIQNGKGRNLADMQLSLNYNKFNLIGVIESLTLISGHFTGQQRKDFLKWLDRTITDLSNDLVLYSTYKITMDDSLKVITLSIDY
jgi:hypothetical protein